MKLTLIVEGGRLDGRKIEVGGEVFTIGRSSECDLRIKSRMASRKHAAIVTAKGYHFVVDLGSRHGTRHAGNQLEPQIPSPISDDDLISISELVLRCVIENSAQEASDAGGSSVSPPSACTPEDTARVDNKSSVDELLSEISTWSDELDVWAKASDVPLPKADSPELTIREAGELAAAKGESPESSDTRKGIDEEDTATSRRADPDGVSEFDSNEVTKEMQRRIDESRRCITAQDAASDAIKRLFGNRHS